MSHEHNVGDSDESADEKKMEQQKKAGRQAGESVREGEGGLRGSGRSHRKVVGGRKRAGNIAKPFPSSRSVK